MSNPNKEPLNSELEKAKVEGKSRLQKIQQIIREAVSQTVIELKEGSREINSIFRSSPSNITVDVIHKQQELKPEIAASVENVEIVGRTVKQLEQQEIPWQLSTENQALETEIEGELAKIEVTETTASSKLKSRLEAFLKAVQEQEEFASLRQQYAKLRARLEILDAKLAERYGDRYENIKQQLRNTKPWYENQKAQIQASGIDPVRQKQAEIEVKLGQAGVNLAKTEQLVKQHLKELWQIATKA